MNLPYALSHSILFKEWIILQVMFKNIWNRDFYQIKECIMHYIMQKANVSI